MTMTADQTALPFEVEREPTAEERRFAEFLSVNSAAVEWIERRALADCRRATSCGWEPHLSMGFLFEALRFDWTAPRCEGAPYKLNHDFRAPLTRYLVKRHPELAGAFKTRASRSDRWEE